MNDKHYLILAWTGVVTGWTLQHISTVAVITASLIAAGASYYSLLINRRKNRQMRAAEEHACEVCLRTQNPFNCPHPAHERPENCWLRREIEAQKEREP